MAQVNKVLMMGAAIAALSACVQEIPDSGAGVGFGDYTSYQEQLARQEAALAQVSVSDQTASTGTISSEELAALGIGPSSEPATATSSTTTTSTASSEPVQSEPISNGGISDEQEFSAVAERETIESDAARLAANAAQYQVAEVTALPVRDGDEGPNIVEYALNAPNKLGQPWYSRIQLFSQTRFETNCAKYNTPDDAQRDFLLNGGPERDPMGLDPDGDGFACGWDPEPFRLAFGMAPSN
ncbi:MAG TPA: hypothetical protein VLA27_00950 [Paracoccaceae bacterium]|nr:hypothetical protein [Paracoccaceae bacterium]